MKKNVSVIIRTKNEERWITQCLNAVFSQNYKNFEVIIVDNKSEDKTIEKIKQFKIKKIVMCDRYLPGKALNLGIKESEGDYIACLSGHCIPVNESWLGNLVKNFEDKNVAGVYGRQEPMSFTSNADKRDLAIVFGLDRKVQIKDSFFHNANSMIRKDIWRSIPFDPETTNIEDRLWAQKVLRGEYRIIYEPEASVYHYHGIHQDGNSERCNNVVRILENMHENYRAKSLDIKKMSIIAVIPVKGDIQYLGDKPLLYYTIQRAKQAKYIKKIIVSTDNKELAGLAESLGAEVPFLRDESLSKEYVDLGKVYQYSINKIEELGVFPDLVALLEVTFPFRPRTLLDDMIVHTVEKGLDSVVIARKENKGIWKDTSLGVVQVDEGFTPRQFKNPTFVELEGVGCVTHPEFLRQGNIYGRKIGFYEIHDPYSYIEVRSKEDFKLASVLVKEYFK